MCPPPVIIFFLHRILFSPTLPTHPVLSFFGILADIVEQKFIIVYVLSCIFSGLKDLIFLSFSQEQLH
jgi:hypothetical protein